MASDSKLAYALNKKNYTVMLIGIVTLAIGYMLMSGGGSPDPNTFNGDELFSFRRITIAPIVVLIGYGIVGYSIMMKPKSNEHNKA